jgi:hypothetical protein
MENNLFTMVAISTLISIIAMKISKSVIKK